jgi:hypothetical protein
MKENSKLIRDLYYVWNQKNGEIDPEFFNLNILYLQKDYLKILGWIYRKWILFLFMRLDM